MQHPLWAQLGPERRCPRCFHSDHQPLPMERLLRSNKHFGSGQRPSLCPVHRLLFVGLLVCRSWLSKSARPVPPLFPLPVNPAETVLTVNTNGFMERGRCAIPMLAAAVLTHLTLTSQPRGGRSPHFCKAKKQRPQIPQYITKQDSNSDPSDSKPKPSYQSHLFCR